MIKHEAMPELPVGSDFTRRMIGLAFDDTFRSLVTWLKEHNEPLERGEGGMLVLTPEDWQSLLDAVKDGG